MQIKHVLSADTNRGPVSIIRLTLDNEQTETIRISPNAKMGRVAVVDESEVVDKIYSITENASYDITDEFSAKIEADLILRINGHGVKGNAIGWRDNEGKMFSDGIERDRWMETHRADLKEPPKKGPRRIMLS